MKKFYNKVTKQQWRVTVPNINTSLFRRTPVKDEEPDKKSSNRCSSGSYDLEEAQRNFENTHSLPNSIFVSGGSETSKSTSDEDDDKFEDARTSDRTSNAMSDSELYVDVTATKIVEVKSKNIDSANSKYEYDVPKISFSFFERQKLQQQQEQEQEQESLYQNEEAIQKTNDEAEAPKIVKTEVRIILAPSNLSKSPSLEDVSTKSLESLPVIIKCGSDPNLRENNQDEDDGLYKIPRQLLTKGCRLSLSLNDVNVEAIQTIISRESSIEHISCSQVLVPNREETPQKQDSGHNSESMDYCKVRSRLPLKIRRPTFLRKPKKAIDTWNNFRTKFNNMMVEQASQQRVGAYGDKERVAINLEEVYKTSKLKCKNALKIFAKKPTEQDSLDKSSESSSQIVKNDAFFAKVPLTPSDIEYKLNYGAQEDGANDGDYCDGTNNGEEEKKEFDFTTIRSAFRRSKFVAEGQNGFEDLRRYVKQGGDFCKELATILQERAETEMQYAKNLSKLSTKLARGCRDGVGGLNEAWKAVAIELEARAEAHRVMGAQLLEETAKPLRNLTETQHRTRKHCESAVDKAGKSLADWRAAEAKGKKQSHTCARDNEKLQDSAILDTSKAGKLTLSRSTSLIQIAHMHNKSNSDKENAKLEGKKRKAEDAVKKADIEYYTLCVRAEKSRLEWESAVLRGVNTFQALEDERLNNLKMVLSAYHHHSAELGPRLIEAIEKLKNPVTEAEPSKDLTTFINLRQTSQQVSEQLLPDFYCEHITLAMNRERRKQALVKLLHLIRQDIERERKSKNGLENLSKAIKQTPNFGAEDSQQSVSEKLYHMKSMLTYLEGARYKLHNSLAEMDSKPRSGHPLAAHITITRDKSGLQQSILKVPQWLREEWFEPERSPVSEKSMKSNQSDNSDPHNNDLPDPDWTDRGAADGNSNQPDSDFDEFSSQCSSAGNLCGTEDIPVQPIAQCKALYAYTPNLTDELALQPGDLLSVYRQQDDGWWLGECRGNVGIFPATYVELINSN